jgi:hypothetical protein
MINRSKRKSLSGIFDPIHRVRARKWRKGVLLRDLAAFKGRLELGRPLGGPADPFILRPSGPDKTALEAHDVKNSIRIVTVDPEIEFALSF